VASTAHRILCITNDASSLKYKDYADKNKQKIMTLEHAILPKSFVKIRYAGYLHAKDKMERIASVCKQLKLPEPMQRAHTERDACSL